MSQLAISTAPPLAATSRVRLALMVLGFVLLWSSAFSAGKIAVADCPPLIFLAVRFFAAGVLMMALAAVSGIPWTLTRRDVAVFAALGVANQAVYLGIGYVARQTGFISERAGEGLSEFVFTLSLPCLIFRTLVRAEIPDVQPWGYWISYFVGVAVVWVLATEIGKRFFGIKGISGVVGHDEEREDELRAIEFPRIKGGKHFDVKTPWFVEMLKDIGQIP